MKYNVKNSSPTLKKESIVVLGCGGCLSVTTILCLPLTKKPAVKIIDCATKKIIVKLNISILMCLCACRDAKTYKRANFVCVNFFLARVKSVQNFYCFVEKVSNVAISRFLVEFFGTL